MMTRKDIEDFLSAGPVAVIGVSSNRRKSGNALYRALREHGTRAYPVHKTLETVEGDPCFRSVIDLKGRVKAAVTVVHPHETEVVVGECIEAGITSVWMQLGSESKRAIETALQAGMRVIHGKCLLMFLEPVRSVHAFHRWVDKLIGKYPRTA
jgi:predicted CoA-binding protein